MSERKDNSWTTWVALSTAGMAVFAAVTTLYMGKYTSRAVMLQGQESDQWAYYQAKSIKSHTYELQRENMEIEFLAGGARVSPEAAGKCRKALARYEETIGRYDREKEEIKAKAETLAKEKVTSQLRGGNFGYALIFLQISIMLSSIAAITKRRPLWYLGLAGLAGWLYFTFDAIYLFR